MDFEAQLRELDRKDEALVRKKLEELEAILFGELPLPKAQNEDKEENDPYEYHRDGEMHTATRPADPSEWTKAFPYLRVRGVKCKLHDPSGVDQSVLAKDCALVDEVLEIHEATSPVQNEFDDAREERITKDIE